MKHLERLRKMVTWAAKNEWINRDPFINFKLSFKKAEREYLTASELNAVIATELPSASLQKVRDLFLFSCYTGLAFTDLMELKPHHIVEGSNNTKRINTVRAKTDIRVNVPLLQPAEEIMVKYSKDESAIVNGTVFPRISNQDMNRNLKIIAGLSKVGKLLTFHMARHTFATTVTLMNGVPIESISKMLGHSKITTTMIYAKVNQSKLEMDMQALQEKMNGKTN